MKRVSTVKQLGEYYRLTKPGIIRGNLLTAIAGFLLASRGTIDWSVFIGITTGTILVIASGCVFNNYIDRDIDKKMKRTANRALVTGTISGSSALIFAGLLGLGGLAMLFSLTNSLTTLIGFIGLYSYVVLYGLAKRKTKYGTLIGSIPGAIPPLAGYTAVTGSLDMAAGLLFLALVTWQIPHFYAIAIFRSKDYAAAGLPVLPLVDGVRKTKYSILYYVGLFTITATALTLTDNTGGVFLAIVTTTGLIWLWFGIKNFRMKDSNAWARQMFFASLFVLLVFSFALSIDSFMP